MVDFLRNQTPDEAREFQNIFDKKETLVGRTKKALQEEEKRCTKAHIPFCYKAASMKAKEEIDLYLQRIANGAEKAIAPVITAEWLKQFTDPKNFIMLGKQEARENILVGIGREQRVIGYHYDFMYIDTKFHVAVFVPMEDITSFEAYIKDIKKKE